MATFNDLTGLVFDAFCGSLGCGGAVGLTFVGIFATVVFILVMFRLNLALDGVLVGGGFMVILLSQAGYISQIFAPLVWGIAGLLWASAIWKYARG